MTKRLVFAINLFFLGSLVFAVPSWYDYFVGQCHEVGIPVSVAYSILVQENPDFNPKARSSLNRNGSRDLGLWQLNSKYVRDFVSSYWRFDVDWEWDNPLHSTYVAVRHIRSLYLLFGKEPVPQSRAYAVALAYNCGYTAVKSGAVPASSADYAAAVVGRVWRLK